MKYLLQWAMAVFMVTLTFTQINAALFPTLKKMQQEYKFQNHKKTMASSKIKKTACGAENYQEYIGKALAEIMEADLPGSYRVLGNGRPYTKDLNYQRLNVIVDSRDMITNISCG